MRGSRTDTIWLCPPHLRSVCCSPTSSWLKKVDGRNFDKQLTATIVNKYTSEMLDPLSAILDKDSLLKRVCLIQYNDRRKRKMSSLFK